VLGDKQFSDLSGCLFLIQFDVYRLHPYKKRINRASNDSRFDQKGDQRAGGVVVLAPDEDLFIGA
jgi:hypothetical protein